MVLHDTILPAIKNERNEKLAAIWSTHAEAARDVKSLCLPVTILCHGFRDSKYGQVVSSLAEGLPFDTVRFDFSGNGESEGTFRYSNYADEVQDLRAVVMALRKWGAKVEGIAGHSKGGNVVLMYASRYGDVDTVINVSGRYEMKRGVAERFGKEKMDMLLAGKSVLIRSIDKEKKAYEYTVTPEELQARMRIDMEATVKAISAETRVLTIHGDCDETIPVDDAWSIGECVRNGEVESVKGAGHTFCGFMERVTDAIVRFGVGEA